MTSGIISNGNQDDVFDILDGTDDFPFLNKVSKESFSVNLDKLIQQEEKAQQAQQQQLQQKQSQDDVNTIVGAVDAEVQGSAKKGTEIVDDFNVDEFLYKNFRFISLQDLNTELSKLNNDLDTELFNLVNDDYDDFIKLGKSINSDNFLSLVSSIKLSIANYHESLKNQQEDCHKYFQNVNNGMHFKKKVFKVIGFLEKTHLLYTLINSFEKLIHEQSVSEKDTSKPSQNGSRDDENDTQRDQQFNFDDSEGEEEDDAVDILQKALHEERKIIHDNNLNIRTIKDLTSLYLSIHQIQQFLTEQLSAEKKNIENCKMPSPPQKATRDLLDISSMEENFKSIDVLDNMDSLNSITIDNLLNRVGDNQSATQAENNQTQNIDNAQANGETDYYEDDLYHHVASSAYLKNNKFLEEQFKKINKLRLEFKSILDEYLRKTSSYANGTEFSWTAVNSGAATHTSASTANASSTNLPQLLEKSKVNNLNLKKMFLKLKLAETSEKTAKGSSGAEEELLELLGIYLILGDEQEFLKIIRETKKM